MEKESTNKEPLPGRMEVLRDLPADIMRSLSKEEIRAFLFEEVWPVSLSEKLEQYVIKGRRRKDEGFRKDEGGRMKDECLCHFFLFLCFVFLTQVTRMAVNSSASFMSSFSLSVLMIPDSTSSSIQ